MTKYYYAGAERIAMRSGTGSGTAGLVWIVGDHLGSTAFTVNAATGLKQSELRYKPWGEARYTEGETGTKYGFTGQMAEVADLYFYGARFYDSYTGRWTQPDSLVPNPYNPLAWDRYQFVRSNPLKFTDPSGHRPCDLGLDEECDHGTWQPPLEQRYKDQLRDKFGLEVTGKWTEQQLFGLLQLAYSMQREVIDNAHSSKDISNSAAMVTAMFAWLINNNAIGRVIAGIKSASPNPPMGGLIAAGIVLTAGILITEGLLIAAEVFIGGLMVAGPLALLAVVGMEVVLFSCSTFLLNFDVAYWAYTYRIATNPSIKQEFIWIPPYGLLP